MTIETQLKISSDPMLIRFIREYPIWYKYLNRNPESIKDLEVEMKSRYKLTTKDRLEKINNSMNLIHSFMDVLK